ncbi:hypothetical protein CkaCkLH20_10697 [Colletotrichum karsti]|uniref:Uncharacterized protein n=1 Tax=Colletotrichum karsti TaxID=1095194 RepID=A0A9P6HUY6_9PEZI|nr:uncharacterized protein CkaCkLH20_10697 [Colletotrichum karsti]KAF9871763.1 hypothetical protein CkaCkLH20_10697 [Colletotrichum karsti]
MQLTTLVSALTLAVNSATAIPVVDAVPDLLDKRQTASGCNYFSSPRCCVPAVCQSRDGAIYQINTDAIKNNRHGCDPPWAFIAKSNTQFPGYCCR